MGPKGKTVEYLSISWKIARTQNLSILKKYIVKIYISKLIDMFEK